MLMHVAVCRPTACVRAGWWLLQQQPRRAAHARAYANESEAGVALVGSRAAGRRYRSFGLVCICCCVCLHARTPVHHFYHVGPCVRVEWGGLCINFVGSCVNGRLAAAVLRP